MSESTAAVLERCPDPTAPKALPTALARLFGGGSVDRLRVEPRSAARGGPGRSSQRVRCWLPGGGLLDLLWKRAPSGAADGEALRSEARVYREILAGAPLPAPHLRGSLDDGPDGWVWLFVEDPGGERMCDVDPPDAALEAAAAWIGAFHAHAASAARARPRAFPGPRDADRYRDGLARMLAALAGREREVPWLAVLARRLDEVVGLLKAGEPTVVHGAYRPERIVRRGFRSYPVDWDEAALAPGELDLASLCEGAPAAAAQRCTQRYLEARGPGAWRAGFERRLAAARLFACAERIAEAPLGVAPGPRLEVHACLRLAQLRSDALRLGLLG